MAKVRIDACDVAAAVCLGRVLNDRDCVARECRQTVLRDDRGSWRVLAIDTTYDAANLGGMIRSASAFGVDALLLSDDSCDAWYRRSVRVSMGHIFRVPVVRCVDLAATLRELQESAGLRCVHLYRPGRQPDCAQVSRLLVVSAADCAVGLALTFACAQELRCGD